MVDLSRFGTKHECCTCATKFYDFNKPRPACPKCGEKQSSRKKKAAARAKALAIEKVDKAKTSEDDEVLDGAELEGRDSSGDSDGDEKEDEDQAVSQ